MKTEINGDWKGYIHRFKLPDKNAFTHPLKHFALCLLVQVVAASVVYFLVKFANANAGAVLFLVVSSMIVGALMFVICKYFWKNALEEAKGLCADLIMWIYYLLISTIIIFGPFLALIYGLKCI